MKTENTNKKLEEILHNINKNNFENALTLFNNSSIIKNDIKLSYKLLATIYFKKGDWQKSIDYYEKRFDALKKTIDKFGTNKKKNNGHKSSMPIFNVGMPRSGTTLIEQIISSHSKIFGGGELFFFTDFFFADFNICYTKYFP